MSCVTPLRVRLADSLKQHRANEFVVTTGALEHGFTLDDQVKLVVLTGNDITGGRAAARICGCRRGGIRSTR